MQQVDEEVDKIQIQCQSTQQRNLLSIVIHFDSISRKESFDFLCIVSSQPDEEQDTDVRNNQGHHGTVKEQIHQRSDNQSDYTHDTDTAQFGQVLAGEVPISAMVPKVPAVIKKVEAMELAV